MPSLDRVIIILHLLAVPSRQSDQRRIARSGIGELLASRSVRTSAGIHQGPAAVVLRVGVQVQVGQSDLAIDHLLGHRLGVRHFNVVIIQGIVQRPAKIKRMVILMLLWSSK